MSSESDDDAGELEERAQLREDTQVREFLRHYLSIPDAEGRAHLMRIAAAMAPGERPRDLGRRAKSG